MSPSILEKIHLYPKIIQLIKNHRSSFQFEKKNNSECSVFHSSVSIAKLMIHCKVTSMDAPSALTVRAVSW